MNSIALWYGLQPVICAIVYIFYQQVVFVDFFHLSTFAPSVNSRAPIITGQYANTVRSNGVYLQLISTSKTRPSVAEGK
jgi:hypothetical protein